MASNPPRYPSEILPNLYLGSLIVAENESVLRDLGVVAVLNASNKDYTLPSGIDRLNIAIPDRPESDIKASFSRCCDFIKSHVEAGILSMPTVMCWTLSLWSRKGHGLSTSQSGVVEVLPVSDTVCEKSLVMCR